MVEETVIVGLTIEDATARQPVALAVEAWRAHAVVLPRAEVVSAATRGRLDAWVYDLAPWDASVVQLVNAVCAGIPRPAIWLLHPPRLEAVQLLAQLPSRKRLWATAQFPAGSRDDSVRSEVARMLSWVPRVWLTRMLKNLLGPRPPVVEGFLEDTAWWLSRAKAGRPKLADITCDPQGAPDRTRARRLERLCAAEQLPTPSTLLRDLTLVFVAFQAYMLDLPVTASARRAGFSRKALRQLRHAVLGKGQPWGRLAAGHQFAFAIAAFAQACGVPRLESDRVIDEVRLRMA